MKFKKLPRKANAKELKSTDWRLAEWRLASKNEVDENIEDIKKEEILGAWDIVRLLDGWVDGPGYGYQRKQEYKTGIGEMLLVKVSKRSEIYAGVWSPEGRKAALLLSCEDKITQGICLVLSYIVENFKESRERQAELDRLMESVKEKFPNGRTLMHYAADQRHNPEHGVDIAQLLVNVFDRRKQYVTAGDKYRRTALHFAAFHGNTKLCKYLIGKECGMSVDETDQNGENLLHFAVNGIIPKSQFENLCELQGVKEIIASHDVKGKTALHKAAGRGGTMKAKALLSKVNENIKKEFICKADHFGGTALHEGARGGHINVVKLLLEEGSRPLDEREFDGKTALHYAAQLGDNDKALEMVKILLLHYEHDEERRSLLLWSWATGIGTAEDSAQYSHNDQVKAHLQQERDKMGTSQSLLKIAIKHERYDMARELVNRGANPAPLTSCFETGSEEEKRAHKFVNKIDKMIEKMAERGRDQPTIEDGLGRKYFAEGLAALFLNPCVKTPVTVGIMGDWGMGKSSLMIQTEAILLQTAAKLAFPNLLGKDFPGSEEFVLSKCARIKYEKIKRAVKDLKLEDSTDHDENPLVSFLDKYRQQYHEVYRSLALMDRKDMFDVKNGQSHSSSKPYSLENIPTILTVRYNAWEYQNEHEAWAGLAIEIPKAIEESMTSAQRLRCRWRYVWMNQRNKIYLELIVPCVLALFLSGWVAWVLWTLFRRSKNKELVQLTYGSIPITIVLAVWTVVKQVLSVFKPISDQIMGYLRKPDHSENLGYQHQVISDINFSKEQLGEKPSRLWKFIAWLWSLCGLYPDTVKDTSVPKSPPPCKDAIRIIVFVDDLDRCEDTVILKVMSAVSLVLAVCEINVILGMDEKMVRRAIANKFKEKKHPKELAEKYISKIVQLPLALPDTNDFEMTGFLKKQLGSDFESVQDIDSDSENGENIQPERNPDAGEPQPHVCLNICPCIAESCTAFSAKMSYFFKTQYSNLLMLFKSYRALCNPGPEKKKFSVPVKSMLLLPNYSRKEQEVVTNLSKEGKYSQRLPREWKGFLTYHRAAWNILQLSGQVRNYQGWQVELLVWIFCCWQWKDQMNIIIEKWEKLVVKTSASKYMEENSFRDHTAEVGHEEEDGQTISPIKTSVSKNMEENSFRDHTADVGHEKDDGQTISPISNALTLGNIIEIHLEEMEAAQPARTENQVEEKKQTKTEAKLEVAERKKEEEEKEKWKELKKVLSENDVSMDCIQLFQKFRFNCKIKNLPPPSSCGNV